MRITFPYPWAGPVDIPDDNLLGVYQPHECKSGVDPALAASRAITNPIGSTRLSELAKGKRTITIVCDDYTRQTPLKVIIPLLIPELTDARIALEDVKILVALGTHRPMTDEERLHRFGPEILKAFKVVDHNWQDADNLVSVGNTSSGVDIKINRIAAEADLVIGLGQIVPHRIAGYSGGSKIILPGICGAEATTYTHWLGGTLSGDQVLGVRDNPVRKEMDQAGKNAGLGFIVNAICDPKGNLINIVAGDPVEAHRTGTEIARRVFGVKVPQQADIVLIDSFPKDIELWQAAKALYAAELMVKSGGIVILVSPCTEGVSRSHPLILERGYKCEAQTLDEVNTGKLSNLMVASHCLRVGRLIKDRATGILVSNGINRQDAEHLGFIHAQTPQQALDKAFEIKGKGATVTVMRHGGEALPVVEKTEVSIKPT